jgi:hypothetical protein
MPNASRRQLNELAERMRGPGDTAWQMVTPRSDLAESRRLQDGSFQIVGKRARAASAPGDRSWAFLEAGYRSLLLAVGIVRNSGTIWRWLFRQLERIRRRRRQRSIPFCWRTSRIRENQMNIFLRTLCLLLIAAAAGCASHSTRSEPAASAAPAAAAIGEDWQVIGTPAPNSKFAKLRSGMSHTEVESLIGPPDKVASHQTGKAWIPFYFGKDAFRIETYYKGEGKLTFSGSVYGNMKGKLIQVTVDPAEQAAS